jgi:hypothetical protein
MKSSIANAQRLFAALVTLFIGLDGIARAQGGFAISLAGNPQNGFVIFWTAQSVTASGDLPLVPQFQVYRSFDLTNWSALGTPITGSSGQILIVGDTNNLRAFYRVRSSIEEETAQLDNADLASGYLAFGDFFGAELFNANLTKAILSAANMQAADLENADLAGADLSGANLFFIEASGTVFDNSTMTSVNASLGDFNGTSFVGVDLTGADFSSANLANADFYLATTNSANFAGATFNNTIMPDGSVRNQ